MPAIAEHYDVVIVGFGAAGAAAAIEAAENGAKVLVLDRAEGGGATALSGGVVYAGGGTIQQAAVGYTDTQENMFDYLKQEVKGVVGDETLRRFCEESPGMIRWLERHGCVFPALLCPFKTSYPTDKYYLYFSGNEQAWPYITKALPAPRGHRHKGPGLGAGKALYNPLKAAALAKGVTFKPYSRANELVVTAGKVTGVRYRHADVDDLPKAYGKVSFVAAKAGNWEPRLAARLNRWIDRHWERTAKEYEAVAKGVVLSAGGFAFNKEMKQHYAEGAYIDTRPLGTVGDDGSAIAMGVAAGGATGHMTHMTCWRFLTPVSAFLKAVSVGPSGARIANEDLYGATFATHLIGEHEGRGWLILDDTIWREAKSQRLSQAQPFHLPQFLGQFSKRGHVKAQSLRELAAKIGIPSEEMEATVMAYNQGVLGEGDPHHKSSTYSRPIIDPPFYAIDIGVKNAPYYPAAGLTLGGLKVEEETGQVLNGSGEVIEGLYAAGRSAVGICSGGYISGLSIADAFFSGRRAGRHAASLKAAD